MTQNSRKPNSDINYMTITWFTSCHISSVKILQNISTQKHVWTPML